MMLTCEKCGYQAEQIFIVDITNMSKDLKVLCENCRPISRIETKSDGSIQSFKTAPVNPFEVANQLNPDISCDFCNKPNPTWLYDLEMEPLEFGKQMIDLGKRWATCDECADAAEIKSPFKTVLRLGQKGNVTTIMNIHAQVMEHISNKRAYVRSEEDGIIKKL